MTTLTHPLTDEILEVIDTRPALGPTAEDYFALVARRIGLEHIDLIPDMKAYAEDWRDLGDGFAAIGYEANAEMCFSKARHYDSMTGAFTREIESPSYVALFPAAYPDADELEAMADTERMQA